MKMSGTSPVSFEWSTKIVVPKKWIAGIGFVLSLIYMGFRIRPYMSRTEIVIPFIGNRSTTDSGDDKKARMQLEIEKHALKTPEAISPGGYPGGSNTGKPYPGSGSMGMKAKSGNISHLVERPLLDGMSVVLQAVLSRPWASNEGETTVEAKILGPFAPAAIGDVDYSSVQGGTLVGQARANLDTSRVEVRFTELITPDGKHHPVNAVALGPDGQSYGIPAHFSSGSTSRVLGAAIGEVITTADTLATSRVLQNTGDDSVLQREAGNLVSRTAGQAGTELSQEATKDLKGARPVVSVSAGTSFTVKLQSTPSGGAQ